MFCMHVIRDWTNQLDNKDMLKNLSKEMNKLLYIFISWKHLVVHSTGVDLGGQGGLLTPPK